jgi:hypothetical protein
MLSPLQIRLDEPCLFLDGEWMAESAGIEFRVHAPRCECIVLAPEREWEAYRVSPICVIEHDGLFKMWYSAISCHPGVDYDLVCPRCQSLNPGVKVVCVDCGWPLVDIDYLQNEMFGTCYAESSDGIHWERPDLGLVDFRGNRRNNLIKGPCGVPAINPKGSSDERFMGIVEYQSNLFVSVSPDGLRWKRKSEPCLPFCADTTNQIIYNPDTDKYVALLRGFPGRRTTVWCEFDSLDQTPWPFVEHGHARDETGTLYITDELETVLDTDDEDPALPGLDINHISAHRYRTNTWFGFPALFRKYPPAGLDRDGREVSRYFAQGNDGTWETQLAVSRDGHHWTRSDRTAYLSPGIFGGVDGGINSIGIGMIHRDDSVYQYGFGQHQTHGVFSPGEMQRTGSIFMYIQEKDRFIAAASDHRGGGFQTHPFKIPGGKLVMNIECGGLGEGSVEIQDADGTPLNGFTHLDCDRVDLNQLAHVMSWRMKSDLSHLTDQFVRLDIRMQSAKLYAIYFSSL